MSNYSIEVEDVTVTHEVVSTTTSEIAVQSQMPVSLTVSDVGMAGPQGATGATGNTGADSTVPGPATPVDYQGTGFPEGTVTATVGKTYRDNNATNGAILWVKASGTGNTGWKVVYGDTGWRDITSSVQNSTGTSIVTGTPKLLIKRINDTVHTQLSAGHEYLTLNATGDRVLMVQGFYPERGGWWPWLRWDTAAAYGLRWETGGYWRGASGAMNPFSNATWRPIPIGSWAAQASWPVTLPGTAA